MASTSESGHAKSAGNFVKLVSSCVGFGTLYNPSNEVLKIENLTTLGESVAKAFEDLKTAIASYKIAVNERNIAFGKINTLLTRISGALKASGTSPENINSAKTFIRKIKGIRSTPKLTDEEKKALVAQGKEVNEISASQMSFDNRFNNLQQLVTFLQSAKEYNPNETDLQTATLVTMLNNLSVTNKKVIDVTTTLSNARIVRDKLFFAADTGMVDIALKVKEYVKSVSNGSNSQYYKQISGLIFKRRS